MAKQPTVEEAVRELDALCDELDAPNVRGFLTRIPGSKFYRRPPVGCPPGVPNGREIVNALHAARLMRAVGQR